jgi:VCBS repeat-containing protein
VTNAATGAYTYVPAAGQSGVDTFTFRANDGTANSNTAVVTVTIAGNRLPTASNGVLTTDEDRSATGTLVGSDADGNPLTFSIVSGGTLGTVTITNASMGRFKYVPNPNANGQDSFTFRVSDGTGSSNVATVAVTIVAINDAPEALDGATSTTVNTPVNGQLGGVDVDAGDTLTFTVKGAARRGTVTVGADGSFTYTPRSGYVGTDSFTFRVSDGRAMSGTATITVTVR